MSAHEQSAPCPCRWCEHIREVAAERAAAAIPPPWTAPPTSPGSQPVCREGGSNPSSLNPRSTPDLLSELRPGEWACVNDAGRILVIDEDTRTIAEGDSIPDAQAELDRLGATYSALRSPSHDEEGR